MAGRVAVLDPRGRTFPFRNVGAPSLCSLQGRAAVLLVLFCYATRIAPRLWCPSPALYHLLLPSPAAFAVHCQQSRTASFRFWNRRAGAIRFVVVDYVVMPEHIHLLLTEPELGTPSTVMRADDQNARGEAQVYTPQSSRARLGGVAWGMVLEQLSLLSFGWSWPVRV